MFSGFTSRCLRMGTAAIAVLFSLSIYNVVQAQATLRNPEMEDGYITADGDTMPTGYGSNATKVAGKVRMRMDFDTKHSGDASMQIISDTTAMGFWVGKVEGEDIAAPGLYTIGGYVKYENVDRKFQIGIVRICAGGGYCQMDYSTGYQTSGTSLGWERFEYIFDMPTESECRTECGDVITPHVNYHLELNGPGTVWLDSLFLIPPTAAGPRTLETASRKASGTRIANRTVVFAAPVNYRVAVIGADGRTVSTTSGYGREAALATQALAAGAYLVRVTANGTSSSHMLAVQ
jgi:hypothetical protein